MMVKYFSLIEYHYIASRPILFLHFLRYLLKPLQSFQSNQYFHLERQLDQLFFCGKLQYHLKNLFHDQFPYNSWYIVKIQLNAEGYWHLDNVLLRDWPLYCLSRGHKFATPIIHLTLVAC